VPTLSELGFESVGPIDAIMGADVVVLVTAHPGIDYDALASRAALLVDLRGVTRGTSSEHIVRL
jgi:UDP-N-acetyl-D-mannosaminuronate dehydrogenase